MTILVVDDSDSMRCIVCDMVLSFGYRAVQASDADDAVQMYQASPHAIELLLTDINMPGRSGLALAEQLLQGNPDLKVLYMSADFPNSMPPVVPERIDRIAKPFSGAALKAKLHALLPIEPCRDRPEA